MVDDRLVRINFKPIRENSALLIRLDLKSSSRTRSIEFEMDAGEAVAVMRELQQFQTQFDWQPPKPLGPKGKPRLRVVDSSD
jgi:hypothetical protein